jgi:Secretion system C-terminal sorting domain
LTIEAGTLIKANASALVITRGAKIIAKGTETKPIVFTSTKDKGKRGPGDWAGLVLLGKAPINVPGGETVIEGGLDAVFGKYGGTDPNDNSGIVSYVRIEFAGIAFQQDKEVNSLTIGGVGAGTQIDHVQCSYGGDDAFEWFGGTVNSKYLIAFKTTDDMFDTDFGYNGKNQFLLGVSDPQLADISGSNGFESDNDGQGTTNAPLTDAIFSNVTIAGPKIYSSTINTNFKRGAHIRRASKQDVINSVISGFPSCFRPENLSVDYLLDGSLSLKNIVLDENKLVDSSKNTTLIPKFGLVEAKLKTDNNVSNLATIGFTDALNFNFIPKANSPLLSGADFTAANTFFETTTYKGAFGAKDWTKGWANFDPQNTDYSKPLAVKEIETLNFAKIFPNPVQNQATLELNLSQNTNLTIQLINYAGQIITSQNNDIQEGISQTNLQVSNLQNGIYFIKIISNTGVNSLKLTVNR